MIIKGKCQPVTGHIGSVTCQDALQGSRRQIEAGGEDGAIGGKHGRCYTGVRLSSVQCRNDALVTWSAYSIDSPLIIDYLPRKLPWSGHFWF